MKRDEKSVVTEYVANVSDGELVNISMRLNAKLQGDLAEVFYFIARDPAIDALFQSAADSEVLFDFTDYLAEMVSKECKKRSVGYASRG